MTDEEQVGMCEVYGIVSCGCGLGPIETVCTEVGVHRCHNFVISEDVVEAIEIMMFESKEDMIERLKGG